jgi:hypothetical protein
MTHSTCLFFQRNETSPQRKLLFVLDRRQNRPRNEAGLYWSICLLKARIPSPTRDLWILSIPSEPRGADARGWRRERRRGRQQGGGAEAASSTSGDSGGDVRLGSLPDGELLRQETWTLRSGRRTARRSCAMPRSRPWTILPEARPREAPQLRPEGLGNLLVRERAVPRSASFPCGTPGRFQRHAGDLPARTRGIPKILWALGMSALARRRVPQQAAAYLLPELHQHMARRCRHVLA